jgi:hypothetical protein
MSDPGSLDAAWAEAEAALPEDWFGPLVFQEGDGGSYVARASAGGYRLYDDPDFEAGGPTPAAALHALAAKLRELSK